VNENPFNMVLQALWAMLLAHPAFVRDVKENNRIRFDDPSNRDPLKDAVQAGDLPEVAIGTTAATANIMETSSTSMCKRTYTIMVSSGDLRYTEILGRVEWYIWCAMAGWKKSVASLQWRKKTFVKVVNVASVASGLSDAERNRNIKGWSAVWSITVEMHFDTADLLTELAGDQEKDS